MINYNWIISALDCKVKEENLNDVVYTVHWRYTAQNENEINAEMYGAQAIGAPSEDEFTPFDEITKEQVIGWLETSLDVTAMQAQLATQIDLLVNPISVTLPPPFVNN